MTRTETRLLVLGAVLIFEPVNAYQLRRELQTWRVDDWAHVNPGSIYTALATLARKGDLDKHDLSEGQRVVSVYVSTSQGREEFDRLFEDAVVGWDQSSLLGLFTALLLQGLVTRERMLSLLRRRLAKLREPMFADAAADLPSGELPPHLPMITRLWQGLGRFELEWLEDTIARIEAGEAQYLGEPMAWHPASDDPGWQLAADRERYRQVLGLS